MTRRRRLVFAGVGLALLPLTGLGFASLGPAAPMVDRSALWIDTVQRGTMVRQVRGLGTLVPEDVRWLPAATQARVDRILVQAGASVQADSVLLELRNPELEALASEAVSQAATAQAERRALEARLESQRLDQEAAVKRLEAEHAEAELRAEADAELAARGLVADLTRRLSRLIADELGHRLALERKRVQSSVRAAESQIVVARTIEDQRRAAARLKREQVEALQVRAGMAGVLQQVLVEVGQQVSPGTSLARVAQPSRLKAVIRIAETQANDLKVGQSAVVDTRNGLVAGRLARIDPRAVNGTVSVDVALEAALPPGTRPDLTVEGTIEIERLPDALWIGRPANASPHATRGLFRLAGDGRSATRVPVGLGRASATTIEVTSGLEAGDRVVLSDTSAWSQHDRIRLR